MLKSSEEKGISVHISNAYIHLTQIDTESQKCCRFAFFLSLSLYLLSKKRFLLCKLFAKVEIEFLIFNSISHSLARSGFWVANIWIITEVALIIHQVVRQIDISVCLGQMHVGFTFVGNENKLGVCHSTLLLLCHIKSTWGFFSQHIVFFFCGFEIHFRRHCHQLGFVISTFRRISYWLV